VAVAIHGQSQALKNSTGIDRLDRIREFLICDLKTEN
jgi:hypothetical protein